MSYVLVLQIHSWNRWLTLIVTLLTAILGALGWRLSWTYGSFMKKLAWTSVWVTSLQSLVGFLLYGYYGQFASALWNQAWHNPEVRFFGLFHLLAMFSAIGAIHAGAARARKSQQDRRAYAWIGASHGLALLLMLLGLPWQRPWWR